MDNQNANNGGFPQNPNPPQDNNQQPPAANQPQGTWENVRTQSVVESSRDVAEKELAAQEAYNNQILRQQQAEIRRNKEMHIAVKIALAVFGVLILIALIWLVIQIIIGIKPAPDDACKNADGTINTSCCDRPEYKNETSCKEQKDPLPTIDGYKCTNSDCKKMADIVKDERIIIYDGKFYIYDIKGNKTTPTTIDNSIKYNSMSVFDWGKDNYYVILKPATEDYGLYSIADNQQIIPNKLSRIYSDINHKAYKGMQDILGKYILVRESSQYRLYDIKTGEEIASAPEGIFTYKKYIMTYQSGGVRRVYNYSGKQILITKEGEEVYMRNGYVIHFGKSLLMYDNDGVKQSSNKNEIMRDIIKHKKAERAAYLNNAKLFYRMPLSRNYED
ncbi:hypothetical protein J6X15_03250 [Candidatus Saccharibacteria bacterium]|nr:hypothetical protein [Candidatus Saccharibacteria bacterium]